MSLSRFLKIGNYDRAMSVSVLDLVTYTENECPHLSVQVWTRDSNLPSFHSLLQWLVSTAISDSGA